MDRHVVIGDRIISSQHKPFIICEISANHNGSLDKALETIEAAAKTGCDAIKLQTYSPDTMTLNHDSADFKISGGIWDGYKLYDLYQIAQTPFEWHQTLFERAKSLDVQIFSTPFDKFAVDLLDNLGVPAFKIASFELTDIPLIKYVAAKKKPLIISTGLGSLQEISAAVDAVHSVGNSDIILLHCVSSYPAPIDQFNIKNVPHLADTFNVISGLSDHSLSNAASVASVALGGSVIEKHFTLNRDDEGPDSEFSLEPAEFKALVEDCNSAWASLGKVDYKLQQSEEANIKFRRSIYFVKDKACGSVVSQSDIKIIRPGFGIEPVEYERLIGRRLSKDVKFGTPTCWSHFV